MNDRTSLDDQTLPPSPDRPAVPEVPAVPGYDLLGELGRGGMGVVYKARQRALNRTVALKMILAGGHAGTNAADRFRLEAQAVAQLKHPHVVQIYEVGEAAGCPYFSLEFMEGGSLADRLDGTPLAPADAARLVETLARAMHAAHQHGIVHRDLKPANVLLTADGTPKVTDFGLAKQLDVDSGNTRTGQIVGTPSYMAPEQAEGKVRQTGPAADVYALGAILYELLTGRPPFRADTPLNTVLQVVADEPVPPTRLQSRCPRDLETICLKCLQKDPTKRYPAACGLADDLRRFLNSEPIQARPVGALERAAKWAGRRPAVAALLALVAGVTVLGFGLVTWKWRQAESAEDRAQAQAVAEAQARRLAEENEQAAEQARGEADQQRRQAERLLAASLLDHGLHLCEQGDAGQGLLWLTRALERGPADDAAFQRAVRSNLAAWARSLHRLRAYVAHPGGPPRQVVFRPGGKVLLTRGDEAAYLWDADTGAAVGEPLAPGGPVHAAAFSTDGRFVVTGGDKAAHVWDALTGKPAGKPLLHPDAVLAVAMSGDAKTVLTGCADHRARLWNRETAKVVHELTGHEDRVLAVALGKAGKTAVTGSADRTVRVWNAETGKPLVDKPLPHPGPIERVLFRPDGTGFFTAGADQKLRAWTITGQLQHELQHLKRIEAAAVSPDGKSVLTGSRDQTAQLWDAETFQPLLPRLLRHQGQVRDVAYSPDSKVLLTAGFDRRAWLWRAATGRPLGAPLAHAGTVEAAAFAPDGRTIATVSADQMLRLWQASTAQPYLTELVQDDGIFAAAFSPDAKTAVLGTGPQAVVWDLAKGAPRYVLPHKGTVFAVAVSPDGRVIVTGGADRTVRLWDAATGRPQGEPLPQSATVRAVAFTRDGGRFVTACIEGTVQVWDAATVKPLGQALKHPGVMAAAFSPDGGSLVTAGNDALARVWDVATSQQRLRLAGHRSAVLAAAFSPDGRRLVTASLDQTAQLWDAETGKPVAELPHPGGLDAVVFSPGGALLATGCGDGTARLWDAAAGRPLGPPLEHDEEDRIHAVAFSPDGKALLTGGKGGTGRLWAVPAAVEGDAERLRCWLEVGTGLELDAGNRVRVLDAIAWQQRNERLKELGGPP